MSQEATLLRERTIIDRERADVLAPNVDIAIWRDTHDFFHLGRSGQWRELLGDGELACYDARVRAFADHFLNEFEGIPRSAGGCPCARRPRGKRTRTVLRVGVADFN